MNASMTIPASLTLSPGARELLMNRFDAQNDTELLHALRAFGVRELFSDRAAWSRHAAVEAEELLSRLRRGERMPQIVCACPAWAQRLRAEHPEWAALLSPAPRLEDGQSQGQALISGCAALRDWLARELHVNAYTACELTAMLLQMGASLSLRGAARAQERGSRLWDVLWHASMLSTGKAPTNDLLQLNVTDDNPFVTEGTVWLGGQRLRVASVCGADNAMRYLELMQSGRLLCHVMEVRSCASCRA